MLGAVEGEVTGSMHLVELIEQERVTRVLVDVGQTVDNPKADFQNRLPSGLKVGDIDAIVITHAHLDHSGLLPRFYKLGFRGKAYVTQATSDLLEILLPDSGKIQELDAKRDSLRLIRQSAEKTAEAAAEVDPASNGKKRSRKKEQVIQPKALEPLYTVDEAKASLDLLHCVPFGEEVEITRGLKIKFLPASGHILGSAMVHMQIGWQAEKRSVLFAGNIGRKGMMLLRDDFGAVPADYIFMESTYGGKLHLERDDLVPLADILNAALERASKPIKNGGYGAVIIPVFAVGRAQIMLDRLRRLKASGILPANLKVYLDSPMSIKVTEIHRREAHRHLLNGETRALFDSGRDPFAFPGLVECNVFRPELSETLKEPCIILCSPGMGNGGRALSHLAARVEQANCTVVFVGYQGVGTIGNALLAVRTAQIQEAADVAALSKPAKQAATPRYVSIMGAKKKVKSAIEFMPDYSAHGDWLDILRILVKSSVLRTPKSVFLEHGSEDAIDALAHSVRERLGLKVQVPKLKEWIVL
jgi:metallo-beta-lactamase family protein